MSTLTVFEIEVDGKLTGRRYLSQDEADAFLEGHNVPASHVSRLPRATVKPVVYAPVGAPVSPCDDEHDVE